ncbi:MAG TPA: hypothetical protein VGI73_12940 [Solirubrobacterales bacterium]|jgi:hypothetical protein
MSRQRSSHPFAVAVLLVAAALVGALAIGSIWANRQLLDTGSWVSVSGRMLESREVRHRLAVFLADELVAEAEAQLGAVGGDEVAAEVLPRLRRQGPHLAEQAMTTPQFRAVWLRANRTAHRELLRVLDEEAPRRAGGVVINLTPALRELAGSVSGTDLAESIGVGDLGSLVEPGAARIEVLEAEELDQAQDAVGAIRSLPVPATIAFLVLFALALLLGRARLDRTILGVGLSLAAAGALALLARAIAGHAIVDDLLSRDADREAAEAAWRIATSTIVDLSAAAIGLGALIALWAVLAGESRFAIGFRQALAPLLRTPLARLWMLLLAIVVFLALMVLSPIAAFEHPLGIALFAAVFAAGALALARLTIVESEPAPG